MALRNFKGVRSLEVNFGDITNITGDNATGKTTIFDAFTWLLFGKNSEDAKDFNIKTLDEHNNPIHRLDHEVAAVLDVDGREVKLRRVFKEKWVKKRGEEKAEFTGHETEFFVDDVPLQQQEYRARVDFMINENLAKLITNPLYFNEQKWQDRRAVLEAIAGSITNEEIAGGAKDFEDLIDQLNGVSLADFKKKIQARKKLIKDNLDMIPTRIEECNRNMPESSDYKAIEKSIAEKQSEIGNIDAQIENGSKAYDAEFKKIQAKQQEKFALETKLAELRQSGGQAKRNKITELQGIISGLDTQIRSEQRTIENNDSTIKSNKSRIDALTQRNNLIRTQWNEENAKTLVVDEHSLNCPTCKQALPETEQNNIRERLTRNFNSSKQTKLSDIEKEGGTNKATIEKLASEVSHLQEVNLKAQSSLDDLLNKREGYKEDLAKVQEWPESDSPDIEKLQKQISEFIIPTTPVIDNRELKARKVVLSQEIDALRQCLASKDQIDKLSARIKELEAEESWQSQELAGLEKTEFTIDAFSKAKIETIEGRINGKFSLVKFKMFEQQINGGETECCECMVNGVPYNDVNTAGKINAGIDIINALTDHYNVNAPVWIDNRESVIRILPCKSQIINLIAVKDRKLEVFREMKLETAAMS